MLSGYRTKLVPLICLLLAACASSGHAPALAPVTAGQCIIFLHGLARSASSMRKLERALGQQGYQVVNLGYASRKHAIEELAPLALNAGLAKCRSASAQSIHLVTHSLGGILARVYLAENRVPELGRVVMLAPPNQGSEAVDSLHRVPGFEILNGPAGQQLGTDDASVPRQLGPVDFELGIIAGDRTIDPFTSLFLPNPDDGKVSVASTRVNGMSDFIVTHHSHAFIMNKDDVIDQVGYFLRHGTFR